MVCYRRLNDVLALAVRAIVVAERGFLLVDRRLLESDINGFVDTVYGLSHFDIVIFLVFCSLFWYSNSTMQMDIFNSRSHFDIGGIFCTSFVDFFAL